MNKVDRPMFDDAAALVLLANNEDLKSYPKIRRARTTIQAAYDQYVAANGNVAIIASPALPGKVPTYLRKHYASPPTCLPHINAIRDTQEHDICPMCGSTHSGTLDHLLPKEDYPVFAIFSPNLIPACKCNIRRGVTVIGPNPGERILHPYFDKCLGSRLARVRFEDHGKIPKISVELVVPPTHPEFAAINFHFRTIVKKTKVIRYARKIWEKLVIQPSIVIERLEENPETIFDLACILMKARNRSDLFRGSLNCWDSMFFNGLLEPGTMSWLHGVLRQPGRIPDSPLA